MGRGFTLLELVVVLAVISVLLIAVFPALHRREMKEAELFKNTFSSLLESSFSFEKPPELCVNFRENFFSVNGKRVELPYRAVSFVAPKILVNSETSTSYCFQPETPSYYLLNLSKGEDYLSVLFLYPSGEALFLDLKEAEKETLKDKVEKGRIEEWFSSYSY